MVRERMGRLLLEAGCISDAQLEAALQVQRNTQARLGTILVQQGAISEDTLLTFLGQQYGLPVLHDPPPPPDPALAQLISCEWAQAHDLVPLKKIGNRLTIAMVNPGQVSVVDDLRFRTDCSILPIVAREADVRACLHALYGPSSQGQDSPGGLSTVGREEGFFHQESVSGGVSTSEDLSGQDSLLNQSHIMGLLERATSSLLDGQPALLGDAGVQDDSPIVDLVHTVIGSASQVGASDIHFEPLETTVRVRFRLDGVLQTQMTYPIRLRNAVISRLKILAKLDITERRLPQDGRLSVSLDDRKPVDVRLSILPSLHGETAVLRLLNRTGLTLDLPSLGMDDADLAKFLAALEQPDGMVVVTGPTGSGKTTTLYSALQVLNTPDVNIVTAEDPIEYHFTGITQVQIKEEIGLTFATVLRAFLRQDPDIMMVGEIRDWETAQMAVKAALTGHRVLSTLHTGDAVRTVTRLLDMGIEPFMVAASLRLIVAQRLVRRVCASCQQPEVIPVEQLVKIGFSANAARDVRPVRGQGCAVCHGTGYRGRIGLYEVLPVSDALQSLILQRASSDRLRQQAQEEGATSLRQSGLRKIKAGLTTMDEVVSATVLG
ncbi:GspE/PulE family protein [Candidatus Nitronereus thalassa]|uniref:ATPase, T2SS/T4P/T4SS family n=1 Tax=Candidatus Nitronereus thalassa TaxID=3020898 RepID=A0ABU3K7C3_9BACT|nr:ATPase, T2SS/T4P/T4SS family [Candidatus Nitronereus thalassa]MDT7042344.1 ATPase, T2SS/T4P/T4SS family [Candidatus Nitronereus thalassa]